MRNEVFVGLCSLVLLGCGSSSSEPSMKRAVSTDTLVGTWLLNVDLEINRYVNDSAISEKTLANTKEYFVITEDQDQYFQASCNNEAEFHLISDVNPAIVFGDELYDITENSKIDYSVTREASLPGEFDQSSAITLKGEKVSDDILSVALLEMESTAGSLTLGLECFGIASTSIKDEENATENIITAYSSKLEFQVRAIDEEESGYLDFYFGPYYLFESNDSETQLEMYLSSEGHNGELITFSASNSSSGEKVSESTGASVNGMIKVNLP